MLYSVVNTGFPHPLSTSTFPIGIVEKEKFQDFVQTYMRQCEAHMRKIDNNFFSIEVEQVTFLEHLKTLRGEIVYKIKYTTDTIQYYNVQVRQFELNTFDHNNIVYDI
ncbi:MAG: hypothetical protein E6Q38_00935 [Crocinitomicaceae bacterium]|nr:MAG: hypothetical protein E6Q38_00935 [Crocinitomicaceae bacterium]